MERYEYKVVPAPGRAGKHKGAGGVEARFALTLAEVMNEHGANGWHYLRSETMPVEDKRMLRKSSVDDVTVLVFQRLRAAAPVAEEPVAEPAADVRIPPLGPARPTSDADAETDAA
jgi:hypothetical protein